MRRLSGKTWVLLLLTASLAVNAVWVIRSLNRPQPPRRPSAAPPHSFWEPSLSPEQEKEIRRLMSPFRLIQMKYKQQILNKRIEIIESLTDPDLEPESLGKRVDELNVLENALNKKYVETLAQIGAVLDSQQRMQLLLRLSRPWFFQSGAGTPGSLERSP